MTAKQTKPADEKAPEAKVSSHETPEEVVEVGSMEGYVESDQQAYAQALADAAQAKRDKVPVLTQPEVRTSWDEQHDPETHERQAAESQRQLAALQAERDAQNKAYLEGHQ